MDTQEYYKIGSQVKYLRHDTELEVIAEVGAVQAIFIQDGRLMAQVKNNESAHNVHYSTLNCSSELVKAYKDTLQDIRSTSNEGDKLVEEIVGKYNGKVQELTSATFGDPLVLEAVDDEVAA